MTATASRRHVSPTTRALLAKVHLGAKQLGLDDDKRRELLERVTGKRSSADCSDAQLVAVLDDYKAKGWAPKLPGSTRTGTAPVLKGRRPADHPMARKARAMWISLHQLGAVRDASESALEAFAKRQLRVEALQWADQAQGFRLIEALKAIAERHGWSQDVTGLPQHKQLWALKARLVNAQMEKLGLGYLPGIGGLSESDLNNKAKGLAAQIHAREAVAD